MNHPLRLRALLLLSYALIAGFTLLPGTANAVAAEYHVAQTPDASDDNPGTQARPWRTVSHAAAKAAAGDTVFIHPGVYRDRLQVMNTGTAEAPIRFVGVGQGRVVISGADVVDGLVEEDDRWVRRPWTRERDWDPKWADFSERPDGASARKDVIFIDDVMLYPVQDRAQLRPGTFLWNAAAAPEGELVIHPPAGSRPLGEAVVEVSERWVLGGPFGLWPRGWEHIRDSAPDAFPEARQMPCHHIHLKNLHFEKGLTQFNNGGAMITGDHWLVEDCSFRRMNAAGLWIGGADATLRRVDASFNGKVGINGKVVTRALIEDSTITHNNLREYKRVWDAGGIKLHWTNGCTLRRNLVAFNHGMGIWFDVDCEDDVAEGNVVVGNANIGLFYEISRGGTIRDNVVIGSSTAFAAAHSADCQILDNLALSPQHGFGLGGSRGSYGSGGNLIRGNLLLDVDDTVMSWKHGGPEAWAPQARNTISHNTVVTRPGNAVFTAGNTVIGDAEAFNAAYRHAEGNAVVEGLARLTPEQREKLDGRLRPVIAMLAGRTSAELQVGDKASLADVKLTDVWRLDGAGQATGYRLSVAGESVLLILADAPTRLGVYSGGEALPTLRTFSALAGPADGDVERRQQVVAFDVPEGFSLLQGLAADAQPLAGVADLSIVRRDDRVWHADIGDRLEARVRLTNPFDRPTELRLTGPGLDAARVVNLQPGAQELLNVPFEVESAADGVRYTLEAFFGTTVVEQPLDVRRVADASAGKAAVVTLAEAGQVNPDVWDEDLGDFWGGPQDVSAEVRFLLQDRAARVSFRVVDDKVVAGEGGDSVEVLWTDRGGVVHRLAVAAPDRSDWQRLQVAGAPIELAEGEPVAVSAEARLSSKEQDLVQGEEVNAAPSPGEDRYRIGWTGPEKQREFRLVQKFDLAPIKEKLENARQVRFVWTQVDGQSTFAGRPYDVTFFADADLKITAAAFEQPAEVVAEGTAAAKGQTTHEIDVTRHVRQAAAEGKTAAFRFEPRDRRDWTQIFFFSGTHGQVDAELRPRLVVVSAEDAQDAGGSASIDPAAATARGRLTDEGYEVEVSIGSAVLNLPESNVVLMDFAVNDADKPGARSAQLYWNGRGSNHGQDRRAFGRVNLD